MSKRQTPSVSTDRCIYCGEPVSARSEGDHVIPSALGEFEHDVRFRRVCRKHNSEFGRNEAQILRSGPESFFRRIVPTLPKRDRKRARGASKGATGAPPPEYRMELAGSLQMVQPSDTGLFDVEVPDQLIVRLKGGSTKPIRLHPQMDASSLKRAIGDLKQVEEASLSVTEAMLEHYLDISKKIWPNMKFQEKPPTEPGVYSRLRGRSNFRVTEEYFRAIAKIAFHYYLCHSRRGLNGDEPCFDAIRNFILNGGDVSAFFNARQWRMALPLGHGLYPSIWCHLLCADESDGEVLVYLHFFMGPGSTGSSKYTIRISSSVGRLIAPTAYWAHLYIYGETSNPGRFAGHVRPVTLTRMHPVSFRI